jgi:hypothetical protein
VKKTAVKMLGCVSTSLVEVFVSVTTRFVPTCAKVTEAFMSPLEPEKVKD